MSRPRSHFGLRGKWLVSSVEYGDEDGRRWKAPVSVFIDEAELQQARQALAKIQADRHRDALDPRRNSQKSSGAGRACPKRMDGSDRGQERVFLVCGDCGERVGAVCETERGPLLADVTLRRSREGRSALAEGLDVIEQYSTPISQVPSSVPSPMTSCSKHGRIPVVPQKTSDAICKGKGKGISDASTWCVRVRRGSAMLLMLGHHDRRV